MKPDLGNFTRRQNVKHDKVATFVANSSRKFRLAFLLVGNMQICPTIPNLFPTPEMQEHGPSNICPKVSD